MLKRKRCSACQGARKIRGNGMMLKDCDDCDAKGYTEEAEDELEYLKAKNPLEYKAAKDEIMATDEKLTEEEVDAMLTDELNKVNKRGRPRKHD